MLILFVWVSTMNLDEVSSQSTIDKTDLFMKHLSDFPSEVGMTSGHKLKLFFTVSILEGR